jgi:hypothetical protein
MRFSGFESLRGLDFYDGWVMTGVRELGIHSEDRFSIDLV